MRRLISLVLVVLILLAVLFRDRIYVRDPLGSVERNGVAVSGARVFINFSNDLLLQERNDTHMVVVQQWNRTPVTPPRLTCIEGLLCVTPADRLLSVDATSGASTAEGTAQMSNREVTFTDEDGSHVHVTFR